MPAAGRPIERPPLYSRATVWLDQVLDGTLLFPDPTASGRAHGMAINVLVYNIKRMVALVVIKGLMAAIPG
jgi:hypothetical protein